MKYVFLALGSVLVFVVWLNSPDGAPMKRRLFDPSEVSARQMPLE